VKRKTTCALCKRDYPSDECEQSVRGWECTRCIRKKLGVALRKTGVVQVDRDGTVYGIAGGTDEAEPS